MNDEVSPHAFRPFTVRDGSVECAACHTPESHAVHLLEDYNEGTACIQYRDGSGKVKDWFVGVAVADNETTLRHHLSRHLPASVFIGFAIKREVDKTEAIK